jgi:small-conductance mechanosensitive channel
VTELLDDVYFGNSLRLWLIAGGVFVGLSLLLILVRRLLLRRLERTAALTKTPLDDMAVVLLRRTRYTFIVCVALYAALQIVNVPERLDHQADRFIAFVFIIQAVLWGNGLIGFSVSHYTRTNLANDGSSVTMITAMGYLARFVLFSFLLLVMIDVVFGKNPTSLLAGLGIGGIAIALAVQNVLGDLFASLSIVLDKPFVIGDFIEFGSGYMGAVEHIGLKSTHVRSLSGEQIIVPNTDLTKGRVRNYKRQAERRVSIVTPVHYDTPLELIERVPAILRELVTAEQLTRFDRSHLRAYAESALEYETVYFVLSADFNLHMDIQQRILTGTLRRFAAEGIALAFPAERRFVLRRKSGDERAAEGSPASSDDPFGEDRRSAPTLRPASPPASSQDFR